MCECVDTTRVNVNELLVVRSRNRAKAILYQHCRLREVATIIGAQYAQRMRMRREQVRKDSVVDLAGRDARLVERRIFWWTVPISNHYERY